MSVIAVKRYEDKIEIAADSIIIRGYGDIKEKKMILLNYVKSTI